MAGIFDPKIFQNEAGPVGQKLFQVDFNIRRPAEVWWPWEPGLAERRKIREEREREEEERLREEERERLELESALERRKEIKAKRFREEREVLDLRIASLRIRIRELEQEGLAYIEYQRIRQIEEDEEILLLMANTPL